MKARENKIVVLKIVCYPLALLIGLFFILMSGWIETMQVDRLTHDWQTVRLEGCGTVKVPADWAMHTEESVITWIIGSPDGEEQKEPPRALAYFDTGAETEIKMVHENLLPDIAVERDDEMGEPPVSLQAHQIESLDEEEDWHDTFDNSTSYGKVSFNVDGQLHRKFFVDLGDDRYIVWDETVEEDMVQLIARSFVLE